MARYVRDTIARRPASRTDAPLPGSPVNLAHLARQTMGDRDLEREVLGMFAQQAESIRDRFAISDEDERRRLAHTLKGSARSVGAFALADCAARIEDDPSSADLLAHLSALTDEVCAFIAASGG